MNNNNFIKTGDGKIFDILCKLHPDKYIHYKLFAVVLEIGKKNECTQKRKELANQIYKEISNDLLLQNKISKIKYLKKFQKLMQDKNLNCINSGSSTVNYWERGYNSMGEPIKISTVNKYLISDYFGYSIDIWSLNTDNKNLEVDIKILKKNKLDTLLNYPEKKEIEKIIANIKSCNCNADKINPICLYKCTLIAKENANYSKSLKLLNRLLKSDTAIKYKFYQELLHLKAILLSTNNYKQYKKAIEILKILYFSFNYHYENPEIITLLASNYKREALKNKKPNNKLLKSALDFYLLSYNLKNNYYDLVNILYIQNILNEGKYIIPKEYKDFIINFIPNSKSWWETVSKTELLLFLGEIQAAFNIIDLYEGQKSKNDLNITIRQIKLYLTFVKDKNFESFLNYLNSIHYIQ